MAVFEWVRFFAGAVCLIRTVILCHLPMLGRIGGRMGVERGSP